MKAKAKTAEEMFKLLDSDGNGTLDSKEMAMGLFRLGVWLHPKELRALIDVLNSVSCLTVKLLSFLFDLLCCPFLAYLNRIVVCFVDCLTFQSSDFYWIEHVSKEQKW
jgi:hypothetical protein